MPRRVIAPAHVPIQFDFATLMAGAALIKAFGLGAWAWVVFWVLAVTYVAAYLVAKLDEVQHTLQINDAPEPTQNKVTTNGRKNF